mgnify:CR=1 FL=1
MVYKRGRGFRSNRSRGKLLRAANLVAEAAAVLNELHGDEAEADDLREAAKMLQEVLGAVGGGASENAPPGWYQWPWGARPYLDYHHGAGEANLAALLERYGLA